MQQLMRNRGKELSGTDEVQVSFENIKGEFCEAPVLGMPTEKGMSVLETDASVVSRPYSIRNKNGLKRLFSDP